MKRLILLMPVLFISTIVVAQNPEMVVKNQVQYFNDHDVKALVDNVTDDFVYYGILADSVMTESRGKASFHNLMTAYFGSIEGVRSELENISVVENKVSFKETVYWMTEEGERTQSSLGVYEVFEGKIKRVWYFY